jgi:Pre ATP-grasp domain
MTRIFIHCVGSLRSLQPLKAAIPGFDRYPERALLLAEPGDLVCVGAPVDPDYLDFLGGLGLGPKAEDVVVAQGDGTLAERLRAAPRALLQRVPRGGDPVWLEPYASSDAVFVLAAALRCETGVAVRVRAGLPEITAHADQKHLMRERAQAMGIPVAEGEVALLAHAGGRRRGDLGPVRDAIERQVGRTGRVIVRGSSGASGSSTFLVGRGGDDTDGVLRRIALRTDNRWYLVESMVEATASPNLMLDIPADGAPLGPAEVSDQRWGQVLVHDGNQSPSCARLVAPMEGWARMLASWLQREGYVGPIGFDFVEHRDRRTGGPSAFLAEVNPRVNGASYPLAVRRRLAPRAAFVSGTVRTDAGCFAQVRAALGTLLFDPERRTGVVPYATGGLSARRCAVVALAASRLRAAELYGAARARLEAAWAAA